MVCVCVTFAGWADLMVVAGKDVEAIIGAELTDMSGAGEPATFCIITFC